MLYIAQLSIPFQKAYAAEEKTLADCAVKGYKLGFHIGVSDFRNGYTYLHSFRPFLEDSCFAFETTPYQTAPCYVLFGSYLEYIDGWKAAIADFQNTQGTDSTSAQPMGSGDGSGSLGSNGGVSASDSLYTKLGNNGVVHILQTRWALIT